MGKLNLTDAAKSILTEGSKETFQSNISSKHSGGDKPVKLNPAVAYGTKSVGQIGTQPNDVNDVTPDYTKGVATATPPGATPPVGQQARMTLPHQPAQDLAGEQDKDMGSKQGTESSYENIRDRVKAKLAKTTQKPNPGATAPYVPEEKESDEPVVAEEKEEKSHEDAKQDKAMMKKMINKAKMKEDMDALMSGEDLSEEFVSKATTIFEAAVISRAEEVIAEAQEALVEEFELAVEEVKNDLAQKLDEYINYMAEEWVKENQIAITKGLRAEIVEDFITGLRGLFEEHYIDIPEDKVDVVEELANKVEELESSLNEQIKSSVQLSKQLNEQKKNEAIHTACEGLTQTQVEKMKSLAEGIEFTTEDEFAAKMETLKVSYFKTPVIAAESSALNEEITIEDEKKSVSFDPSIDEYVKSISKSLVK